MRAARSGIGRIVAQHEAVILDRRAATRGGDDDRVEAVALDLARPGVDIGARRSRAAWSSGPCDARARRSSPRPRPAPPRSRCRVSRRIVAALISGAKHLVDAARAAAPRGPCVRARELAAGTALRRERSGGRAPRRQAQHGGDPPERRIASSERRERLARPARQRSASRNRPGIRQHARRAQRADQPVGQRPAVACSRCGRARGRPGACSSRPTGRSSCRRGRRGSGRHASRPRRSPAGRVSSMSLIR